MSTRNSVTKQSSKEISSKKSMKINVERKRLPLMDVTNQRSGSHNVTRTSVSLSKSLVPCAAKSLKMKDPSGGTLRKMDSENVLPSSLILESNKLISLKNSLQSDQPIGKVVTVSPHEGAFMGASSSVHISTSLGRSSSRSVTDSTSLVENMSTHGSLKSPGFEDNDDKNSLSATSLERKTTTTTSVIVSANSATSENICKEDGLVDIGTFDEIVDVDKYLIDSQLCPSVACDIYDYLHASEMHNRPCTNYLETIQKDINASMRSLIIDWLVEVAEEYNLVSDTLFLAVNYIDRYLSGNSVKRRHLQLLGVACMMVAAKYEEISPPSVEEFCYITDYTYFREQVLQMEFSVLSYLKFELSIPTIICFMRKCIFVAKNTCEVPLIQLMCLMNFLAELSLLEYKMLSYAPSLIAASATFLAKFILIPSKAPWNCTLRHHTSYKASDLRECAMAIHSLCCTGDNSSSLRAVRKKYSQHKYKFVAKKYCPPSIPSAFFLD